MINQIGFSKTKKFQIVETMTLHSRSFLVDNVIAIDFDFFYERILEKFNEFYKLNASFGRLQNLSFLSYCLDLTKDLKQVFKKLRKNHIGVLAG